PSRPGPPRSRRLRAQGSGREARRRSESGRRGPSARQGYRRAGNGLHAAPPPRPRPASTGGRERARTVRPVVRRVVRGIGSVLIFLGVITLLFVVYQLWGTGLAEARSQRHLKHEFARELHHPIPH